MSEEGGLGEGLVSREHAWLRVDGLLCYLRDGGSTHGVRVRVRVRVRVCYLRDGGSTHGAKRATRTHLRQTDRQTQRRTDR